MRPLRAVALDLSTAATAIASTHDPRGEPFLSVYTIPGTSKRDLHEQISIIETHVRRACGWSAVGTIWQPDVVTIEGTFSREGGSDYPLHALHANIKQFLWRRRIPYIDVSPSTVKVWATGSGATRGVNKVTKDKVVTAVIATYGHLLTINPRDDNQTDAVALLTLCHAAYGRPLAPVPTLNHSKALKGLRWPVLTV